MIDGHLRDLACEIRGAKTSKVTSEAISKAHFTGRVVTQTEVHVIFPRPRNG